MRSAITVRPAPAGLQGFDANTTISLASAQAFVAAGFRFGIRYLSRTTQGRNDLSAKELQNLVAAGLAVMAVQHVEREGWTPGTDLGARYGKSAASNAKSVGLPNGVTIWLDLEGVAKGTDASTTIDYCNQWFQQVASAGYEPGVYVGANCGLDGDALYWRLKTRHYWKSGSDVPDIPHRGYQLVQRIAKSDQVNGIAIDRDVTYVDAFGDAPTWATV